MADGLTISQQGIDVDDALDSQKVLDTRWRYFEIYKELEISLDTVTSGKRYVVFEHGLGFVPFFDMYDIAGDVYIAPVTQFGGPNIKDWTFSGGLVATSTQIAFVGTFSGSFSGKKVILRIYNVNAAEEYEAPLVVANPYQAGKKPKYGMKVTQKSDNDMMRNPELSNFTLNTEGKTLAIQKISSVATDTNTGFTARITHNMGNLPIFLTAYMTLDKSMVGALNPSFIPVLATATKTTLTFRGAQASLIANFAYIVFKELAETAI